VDGERKLQETAMWWGKLSSLVLAPGWNGFEAVLRGPGGYLHDRAVSSSKLPEPAREEENRKATLSQSILQSRGGPMHTPGRS